MSLKSEPSVVFALISKISAPFLVVILVNVSLRLISYARTQPQASIVIAAAKIHTRTG